MQTSTLTLILFIATALVLIIIFMVLLIWLQVILDRKVFRRNLEEGEELTVWHNKGFLAGRAISINRASGTCVVSTDDDRIIHTTLNRVYQPFDQEEEQAQTLPQ
jgi:hypothetical protein